MSVAFSPDGGRILTGSWDQTARLWDTVTGETIRTFKGHEGAVSLVAFSPDGAQTLTGGKDQTVRKWNIPRLLFPSRRRVTSVAFGADGRRVLSGSLDNTARLIDSESGGVVRVFRAHDEYRDAYLVSSVAISSDGRPS